LSSVRRNGDGRFVEESHDVSRLSTDMESDSNGNCVAMVDASKSILGAAQ
jgi:hypothetical protein